MDVTKPNNLHILDREEYSQYFFEADCEPIAWAELDEEDWFGYELSGEFACYAFGRCGDGGNFCVWVKNNSVVHIDSEGSRGCVARDFTHFIQLLGSLGTNYKSVVMHSPFYRTTLADSSELDFSQDLAVPVKKILGLLDLWKKQDSGSNDRASNFSVLCKDLNVSVLSEEDACRQILEAGRDFFFDPPFSEEE